MGLGVLGLCYWVISLRWTWAAGASHDPEYMNRGGNTLGMVGVRSMGDGLPVAAHRHWLRHARQQLLALVTFMNLHEWTRTSASGHGFMNGPPRLVGMSVRPSIAHAWPGTNRWTFR